ncbi:hypothetical protein [Pseudooceanicola spongiae]|uniref:Uncharacterized protein n=1 Tax=Pseudooceanicola spongiae TaxID=2613965 RepID=A0A7L9WQ18_9RHOB|nr:hypothetical protein [Pseudooceanicola spongiae]QOL82401.1 hypothetical protein F3W81_17155 [Pseudooceanicola spongiae]
MGFRFRTKRLAEALSVVADAGFEGMRHNHAVSVLDKNGISVPKRAFALFRPKPFSGLEFGDNMFLAMKDQLIEHDGKRTDGAYSGEWETIQLSLAGWRFLELHGDSYWSTSLRQIVNNVPTIIVSVLGTLIGRWLLNVIGVL